MIQLRWYGDRHLAALERQANTAIRQAAVLVQTRARLLCNLPAKRIRRRRTRKTSKGGNGTFYTQFIGSAPGQPPMVRTSFGRRNILMEHDPRRIIARIGPAVNAAYMAYLELGTSRIAPRPWLRRAADECRAAIATLIDAALRRAAGGT